MIENDILISTVTEHVLMTVLFFLQQRLIFYFYIDFKFSLIQLLFSLYSIALYKYAVLLGVERVFDPVLDRGY